jgi:hypothetical protein
MTTVEAWLGTWSTSRRRVTVSVVPLYVAEPADQIIALFEED